MAEIDRERWPGWHWSGGKQIEVGTPLACGIPFMSPRGGLCTSDPKDVQCVECLKILEARRSNDLVEALSLATDAVGPIKETPA